MVVDEDMIVMGMIAVVREAAGVVVRMVMRVLGFAVAWTWTAGSGAGGEPPAARSAARCEISIHTPIAMTSAPVASAR